jgi:multidrug resistance efflux pump
MLYIYQTTLKYAKKDYERQSQVQDLIDEAKFDNYEMVYESAKAQVEYQQSLLDKTILKAPFDGVIISKEIESGDVVSGQVIKTAFQIQSKVSRKLILEFDQKYHSTVNVGDVFKYKLDGNDTVYTQKISKVYPYSDTSTRKIKAEVITKNLMVGLFGDGYIQVK